MARTYLTTDNSRGNTVTAMSPTFCHIRGWNAGVRVQCGVDDDGRDTFTVSRTRGSNGYGHDEVLGTVSDAADGPRWAPRLTPELDQMLGRLRDLGYDEDTLKRVAEELKSR